LERKTQDEAGAEEDTALENSPRAARQEARAGDSAAGSLIIEGGSA